MNKSILVTTLLLGSVFTSTAFANELKKSCIKDNPLVAGETDATLIQIYAQVCDKKNKDNNNGYLAQAAQRFQQLGRNNKALQLVNELNAKQVYHSSLTDVKFLAGVAIANEALTQMRDKEVRYLSDEAYAPANAFSDAVRRAKPLSVIETKVEETPVKRSYSESKNTKTTTRSTKTSAKTNSSKSKTTKTNSSKTIASKSSTAANKTVVTKPAKAPAKNPFGNL